MAQPGPEDAMVPALLGAGMKRHWAELYQELMHALNDGDMAWEGFVRGATEIDAVLSKLVKGSSFC